MKEYSGRTGIKRWLYTYEDPLLIVAFLGIPTVICAGLILYLVWRF